MEPQKYYWLKLQSEFFEDTPIKLLRKLPDGDKMVVIYLKMQLKSLKSEGILRYEQLLPSYIEELAILIDEDVPAVQLCVNALLKMNLVELMDNDTIYLLAMQKAIGKSGESTERVKKHRERLKIEEKEKELDKEEIREESNVSVTLRNVTFSESSFEMICVNTIIHSVLEDFPRSKVPLTDKEKEEWCIHIDRLKRLDNQTEQDIETALKYAVSDSFWKTNIRSTKKFREKFETLFLQSKKAKKPEDRMKGIMDW